jgi:glucosamine kinase
VRDSLREADKSAKLPPLLEQLMQVGRQHSFDEFVRAANSNLDFAEFFPLVVSIAEAGDPIAQQILNAAGIELANLAGIVIGKLFADHDAVPLAYAGGVFRHARITCESFCGEIRHLHPSLSLNTEVVDPVHGALQMARRCAMRD